MICRLRFTLIGPITWGHSSPLCHALSSLASWTSMHRRHATVRWPHLVNWRVAARCDEWAQRFSNASCCISRSRNIKFGFYFSTNLVYTPRIRLYLWILLELFCVVFCCIQQLYTLMHTHTHTHMWVVLTVAVGLHLGFLLMFVSLGFPMFSLSVGSLCILFSFVFSVLSKKWLWRASLKWPVLYLVIFLIFSYYLKNRPVLFVR